MGLKRVTTAPLAKTSETAESVSKSQRIAQINQLLKGKVNSDPSRVPKMNIKYLSGNAAETQALIQRKQIK